MHPAQHPSGRLAGGEAASAALAIEVSSLARRFGAAEALAGVSVQIRAGEFFCLLGPSGSGKTTLLRMIAGLDVPDAGSLSICGQDMAGIPAHLRPVNTVFQSYALFPHLSVRENIAFGLKMKRVPKSEIQERVGRVMSLVQISALAERRPAQLSGGEKQRVALARAVVNEPKVLLLDEPLGALDLKLRKQLQAELHHLQRRLGITFVHVTHDQDEALAMSDRIAVMNSGRIEQVGEAREIYESPRTQFVAQFLGVCNLVEGRVAEASAGGLRVETDIGVLIVAGEKAGRVQGDKVVLAIRPEKVRLESTGSGSSSNCVTGTLQDQVFTGAETQYTVRVRDRLIHATVLNSENRAKAEVFGDEVVCRFEPEALRVLEQ